jgi:hypothetical protein
MKRLSVLVCCLVLTSCGASGESSRSSMSPTPDGRPATEPVPGEVEVRGTALDARTGDLLAGVRVAGPEGTRAVSDRHGRFKLHGLREGDSGEVRGTLQDGRTDSVMLQPLSKARIDLVLRLE